MSRNAKNLKKNVKNNFALVQYLVDLKHAVVNLSEIRIDNEDDLELNAVYDVNWNGRWIQAEVKFVGDREKCNSYLDNISHKNSIKKNEVIKDKKKDVNSKKLTITSNSKKSETQKGPKVLPEKNLLKEPSEKNSNLEVIKPTTSKSDMVPNKKGLTIENNVSKTFAEQLEERNKVIDELIKEISELKSENLRLSDQLKLSKVLEDTELRKNAVRISFQCFKYLADNSEREELRRLCEDSGKVTLLTKYPTVSISNTQFQNILMSINVEKSNKIVFKELLTALLPDMTLWGSHNASYMRKNYSNVIQAAREFLETKNIHLNNAEFNLSTREMCTKGKNFMKKNGLDIKPNDNEIDEENLDSEVEKSDDEESTNTETNEEISSCESDTN